MNRRYSVSLENWMCPCTVRSLSPGSTGRSIRSVPSRTRIGMGVMNAARRWRTVRSSRGMIPGMCTNRVKASLSPIQPVSGSAVVTVAVRGMSRSSAISPTIVPGDACSTATTPSSPTCLISAVPDEMSRNETACSPCCISTWPAAARKG